MTRHDEVSRAARATQVMLEGECAERKTLDERLMHLKSENAALRSDRERLASAELDNQNLQGEVKKLQVEVTFLTEERVRLASSERELQAALDRERVQMAHLKEAIAEKNRLLENASAERTHLMTEIENLRTLTGPEQSSDAERDVMRWEVISAFLQSESFKLAGLLRLSSAFRLVLKQVVSDFQQHYPFTSEEAGVITKGVLVKMDGYSWDEKHDTLLDPSGQIVTKQSLPPLHGKAIVSRFPWALPWPEDIPRPTPSKAGNSSGKR